MRLVMKDIILLQQNKMEQLRKTGKHKGKKLSSKHFFKTGKAKVNLLKIKLIINMLYVVYIQLSFSNLVLKSCRQLMFFTTFLYRCLNKSNVFESFSWF